MKQDLSKPGTPDNPQPEETGPDFERVYPKHEGSELVKLALSITDTIIRTLRARRAALHGLSSREHAGIPASPLVEGSPATVQAVQGKVTTSGASALDPDSERLSASALSKEVPRRETRRSAIALAGLVLPLLLGTGEAISDEAEQVSRAESAITVVFHVVSRAPDLLYCRDINTQGMGFTEMAGCDCELTAVQARAERNSSPGTVIFARCRYSPAAARAAPPLAALLRVRPLVDMPEKAFADLPR